MSEYQYYEFQAIDRPLTREEMAELRRYSTRAEITSSRFWNEYNWGGFKGDPRRWMECYFDAFLYLANWGSHWFMLRLPCALMDLSEISDSLLEDGMEGWQTQEHVVLSFRSETDDPDWEEGNGWLSSLVGIRASLMRGDRRSLYLGWLAGAWTGNLDEDATEPTVPPGLAELDASHQALADFLRIPLDLIEVAAESSAPLRATGIGPDALERWLAARSTAEKDALLTKLLLDDPPQQLATLRRRIELELNPTDDASGSCERRTVADLLGRANTMMQERVQREAAERAAEQVRQAAEAAERRKRYLASLRGREEEIWGEVDDQAALRHASAYEKTVSLLVDLRDLAMATGLTQKFSTRLRRFREENARKQALIRRLDKAGLSA
ncbi:hypothetical protein [Rhabdochromatium marinum]|uniref:hypothetical protein n=1 Tax=Rhabdochromatium marinum TaxID=48729 RepID=UPI001906D26E|nr:hypothetical protein [Rhabdochromatium marinum]MBK1648366.1 hypothetical protein [Rhabdochromatium marinum]